MSYLDIGVVHDECFFAISLMTCVQHQAWNAPMQINPVQPAAAKRKSRLGLYVPFVGLLILALAWSALWFYGQHRTAQEMDLFMTRQASLGRAWSCPERSISGYPFRIEIRCTNPTFQQVEDGARLPTTGSLGALTAVATTAGALTMGHVILEFTSPLRVVREGTSDMSMNWESARSSVSGSLSRLDRASVEVVKPEIRVTAAGSEVFRSKADKLDLHVREASGQPAGTFDIALSLVNSATPLLDGLMGNGDHFNANFDGRVFGLTSIDRRDWKTTLDTWRNTGGLLRVERLMLSKGAPRAEGKGELRLDDQRRVAGQLDASFINADALMRQFGLSTMDGLIGSVLGNLGGRRNEAPNTPPRERTMRLPITFTDGRVAVGPLRLPGVRLAPLY
jgi:hypothetical protein